MEQEEIREEGAGAAGRGRRLSFSRNQLKMLAIICILGDHVAALFLENADPRSIILRTFGRLTAPLMCFFLVEGFYHTRDRFAYGKRLCIFALISQPAFAYALGHPFWEQPYNVILTLFLSFLCMALLSSSLPQAKKDAGTFILLGASCFCDWALFGPLWVLGFFYYRKEKKKAIRSYCLVSFFMLALDIGYYVSKGLPWYEELWQAGVFLAIPLFFLYDPDKGNVQKLTLREKQNLPLGKRVYIAFFKWFFYCFYPLHLWILGLIKHQVFG